MEKPGIKVGEMERDCFAEGTPVTLANGLSVCIENLKECNNTVLAWDKKEQGTVSSQQTHFIYKGERECVKLTYQDGRTQICTPEHPILTDDDIWVMAKNLYINKDRVKVGTTGPIVDYCKEIGEANGWTLQVGTLTLSTNTVEEYKKTLAFARIVGLLIADETISVNNKQTKGYVFFDHQLDVKTFEQDLSLFTSHIQRNTACNNLYTVYLPQDFIKNVIEIDGILIGKKVDQSSVLPSFIVDGNCPIGVVREFLAGMFGGNRDTCVRRDTETSISFLQTKSLEHIQSLTDFLTTTSMLLKKCGVEKTSLQKAKKTSYMKKFSQVLRVPAVSLPAFATQVGFRYCCQKTQRLEVDVSYRKYLLLGNKISAEDYMEEIKARDWLCGNYEVCRKKSSLPTFSLKIVGRENVGIKKVYDIEVARQHSFLAQGIVSHNCMIAHGNSAVLHERLFLQSDPYQMIVCDQCGTITQSTTECNICNDDKVSKINFPYAAKLLVQQLQAMCLKVSVKPTK